MDLKFRNVNDAFRALVTGIHNESIKTKKEDSRNGFVYKIEEPVLITYTEPKQRVLFNEVRDANPFFHLFEALWMLAGRNDVAALDFYNSNMKNFSDDGKTFNGAYGYRWRSGPGWSNDRGTNPFIVDQLSILIEHLKNTPNSRRAVLQMWNVGDDLLKLDHSKDVCCNTSVMFAIREEFDRGSGLVDSTTPTRYLDMTVTNRSNDVIWGCLGANYVHFTFLQEYVANSLNVQLGNYYHFTNNLYAYSLNWKPEDWLSVYSGKQRTMHSIPTDYYNSQTQCQIPLVANQEVFDEEVTHFIDNPLLDWKEPFLETVAKPMCMAFALHKKKRSEDALATIEKVKADDWRIAGYHWIKRRMK